MASKNIKISQETHKKLAVLCAKKGLGIGGVADFLLRCAMDNWTQHLPDTTMPQSASTPKTK